MADAPADAPPSDPRSAAESVQHVDYKCPHCGATSSVSEVLMGEQIDCRTCHKPFVLGVPVAQPLRDGTIGTPDHVVDAGGGDTEETVLVTHPAAFRNRPGKTLLAILAIALGVAVVIAGLAGGLGLGLIEPVTAAVGGTVVAAVGGVLIAGGLIAMGIWLIKSRVETLTVTSDRTTYRWGIVQRDTTEIRHDDVRNLQVEQSGADRLFGVGNLFLSSSGQDGLEIRAYGVPHPEKTADVVRDLQ